LQTVCSSRSARTRPAASFWSRTGISRTTRPTPKTKPPWKP
jgi:hypothetical protein